jgi:hypothetical protein
MAPLNKRIFLPDTVRKLISRDYKKIEMSYEGIDTTHKALLTHCVIIVRSGKHTVKVVKMVIPLPCYNFSINNIRPFPTYYDEDPTSYP